MIIFWDKSGILLTEYLPSGTTISGFLLYINHRAIVLCYCGKVVLLLHDNASVHDCNIVQTTIRKVGFVELNAPAYSPDTTPSDCES